LKVKRIKAKVESTRGKETSKKDKDRSIKE
jgi:hypothetical protein